MRSNHPLVWACVLLLAGSLGAHVPHDVVATLAISPEYPTDGMVFGSFSLIDTKVFGRSLDGGFEWQEIGTPMTQNGVNEFAFSPDFGVDGTAFAASAGAGVFRTRDRGLVWERVGLDGLNVTDVAPSPAFATNGVVLCTTTAGLYRSDDEGDSWTEITAGVTETTLTTVSFAPDDTSGLTVFAGSMVLHRSTDGGLTWTALQALSDRIVAIGVSPTYTVDGSLLIAYRVEGVALSTDQGVTATPVNTGLSDLLTLDLDIAPTGEVFVSTRVDGVFRADGMGLPFSLHVAGIEAPDDTTTSHYRELAISPQFATDATVLLASTEGAFVSTDGGFSWDQRDVFHQRIEPRIVISPGFVEDGEVYVTSNGGGVYLWTEPRPVPATPRAGGSATATAQVGKQLAPGGGPGAPGAGMSPPPSDPGGGHWQVRSNNLLTLYPDAISPSSGFAQDGTLFFGFTHVYRTTDRGQSWTKLTNPTALSREISVSTNYPNDQQVMVGSNGTGLYLTHDGGETWDDVAAGLPAALRTRRIVFSPDYANDETIFLGAYDTGVWVTHDGAASWTAASTGLLSLEIQTLAVSPDFAQDGTLLAGTRGAGLFRSLDGGTTWTQVTASFDVSDPIVITGAAFSPDFATDRTAFAVTLNGTIHRTTDGGDTWVKVGADFGFTAARDVALSPAFATDRTLFVSSHDGLWRSRDAGAHFTQLPVWTRVDDTHYDILSTGSWIPVNMSGVNSKGVTGSTAGGDSRTFTFFGKRLSWHALSANDAGFAEVWIDGVLEDTIDLYTHADQIVTPFTRTWEEPGQHEVRIVATGTANPFATDARVFDDGFTVVR